MGNQIISLCSCENSEKGKKEHESNLVYTEKMNKQFEEISNKSGTGNNLFKLYKLDNFNPSDVKSVVKSIIETFLDNKKER